MTVEKVKSYRRTLRTEVDTENNCYADVIKNESSNRKEVRSMVNI